MNTPNKLTMLRVALIPVFLLFFYASSVASHTLWALAVFAAASLTDMLDGQIARKHNLVTDFGKFIDPLADKLLVVSAMICLMDHGYVPALVVILIISREFLVTSLRLVAAPRGIVIAADKWGKLKTASQMAWIIGALLLLWLTEDLALDIPGAGVVNGVLAAAATALTVASGCHYIWRNRHLLNQM